MIATIGAVLFVIGLIYGGLAGERKEQKLASASIFTGLNLAEKVIVILWIASVPMMLSAVF